MKEFGIPKVKLGEVLGTDKKNDIRTKYARGKRFLEGNKKGISLEEINQLASFFNQPIEFFLYEESVSQKLKSSEKNIERTSKGESEIKQGLEKMGFPPEFIELQIQQLRLLKKYQSPR